MLGLVLLMAAALKVDQLAAPAAVETNLLTSRWALISIIELELAFGFWLCANFYTLSTHRIAIATFLMLGVASLSKAVSGEPSCGCFGNVPVNPWLTVLFDLTASICLATCRPRTSRTPPRPVFALAVAAAPLSLAMLIAISMRQQEPVPLDDLATSSGAVVLEPQRWVGRRFPLIRYIDIGEKIVEGKWELLFYRRGCDDCRKAIAEKARQRDTERAPQLALIEIPVQGQRAGDTISSALLAKRGTLSAKYQWFMRTPLTVSLDSGHVHGVQMQP